MTKEQHSAIPEELYNLTQLAEVTLAAGRLSTTNIGEIKEYIGRANGEAPALPPDVPPLPPATTVTLVKRAASSSPLGKRPAAVVDDGAATLAPTAGSQCATTPNSNNNQSSTSAATSSCASSDDDSNCYKYSHKVFDRRKLRRSTISISDSNSRYDEHSCSSLPSCSSDEQQQHLLHAAADSGDGAAKLADDSGGSSLSLLDDEHICPECGKKYSTSSNLARHRQTHRSIMDKKARRCPYCEKVYVSMPAFAMHVRTHSQGCECKFCGKCFSRPWLLQGHIRTHTGEKPFKCNVCNKAFADKSNLRAHIQTHSNTKPHTCNRCGKAFALKSYLYKHEESSCMKNHTKSEREPPARSSRSSSGRAHSKSPAKGGAGSGSASGSPNGDSAKSTLATKLLQKEKDRRLAELAAAAAAAGVPALPPPPATALNLQVLTSAAPLPADASAVGGGALPAEAEKSYTTLTNSMTQEDYERFKRISVIQPTAVAQPIAEMCHGSAAPPAPLPPPYYNGKMQEQPVDFSPKNNFTHASKTSPFELTGNYAMVA